MVKYHVVDVRDENRTDYFWPTDRRLTECKNGFGRIVARYGHGYGYRLTDTEMDMVLLVSDCIQRYTIFHSCIRTISDKISSNELLSTWLGREDKRDLYILSYGTETPPCKAQASFIWIYIYLCRKIYELILFYYQQEIWQNVYPQPNHIRSIFSPYSLLIDSDSVFVSIHYPRRFRIRKNMVTNTVSLLSIRIRSVFTPSRRSHDTTSEITPQQVNIKPLNIT
jgi:hypothetical protein